MVTKITIDNKNYILIHHSIISLETYKPNRAYIICLGTSLDSLN